VICTYRIKVFVQLVEIFTTTCTHEMTTEKSLLQSSTHD